MTPAVVNKQLLLLPELMRAEPVRLPPPGRPWTVEDLYNLAGDENRYELVRGELLMMSPASPVQGRFASRRDRVLADYVEAHDLGEVYVSEPGFVLQSEPEQVIRAPGVAFVASKHIPPPAQQAGFWPIAPDLAVEIISPSETAVDIQQKVQDYLNAGTRLVWLVYPSAKMVVEYQAEQNYARHLGLDDELEGGEVIPGFRYSLQMLFREKK